MIRPGTNMPFPVGSHIHWFSRMAPRRPRTNPRGWRVCMSPPVPPPAPSPPTPHWNVCQWSGQRSAAQPNWNKLREMSFMGLRICWGNVTEMGANNTVQQGYELTVIPTSYNQRAPEPRTRAISLPIVPRQNAGRYAFDVRAYVKAKLFHDHSKTKSKGGAWVRSTASLNFGVGRCITRMQGQARINGSLYGGMYIDAPLRLMPVCYLFGRRMIPKITGTLNWKLERLVTGNATGDVDHKFERRSYPVSSFGGTVTLNFKFLFGGFTMVWEANIWQRFLRGRQQNPSGRNTVKQPCANDWDTGAFNNSWGCTPVKMQSGYRYRKIAWAYCGGNWRGGKWCPLVHNSFIQMVQRHRSRSGRARWLMHRRRAPGQREHLPRGAKFPMLPCTNKETLRRYLRHTYGNRCFEEFECGACQRRSTPRMGIPNNRAPPTDNDRRLLEKDPAEYERRLDDESSPPRFQRRLQDVEPLHEGDHIPEPEQKVWQGQWTGFSPK